MNGPHDLGGAMGFGPVLPEMDEPVFHHEWEKKALGLSLCVACLGAWTLEENRHAYERVNPVDYLKASYYEIWIRGLEMLLVERGILSRGQLYGNDGISEASPPRNDILKKDGVEQMLASGPSELDVSTPPAFGVGQSVLTCNIHPKGHTRLPRYARGKRGVIERVQGSYAFADDHAHGRGANPQWVYTVVFSGNEIWGRRADPNLRISIDAFESYLEAVTVKPCLELNV